MGSKVKVIDEADSKYGSVGYVLSWKHDNDSGVTAVKVQFLDDTTRWFEASQILELE